MLHTMRQGIFSRLEDLIKDYLTGKKDLIGIEIGSYAGESAEMFVNSGAFKQLYCIDPWEMNYDPSDCTGDEGLLEAEKAFDARFKDSPVVVKIKDKSEDAVSMFRDETIDFIYIDGNHQYESVKRDLELYVPKIKLRGIIAGHDYGGPTTPGATLAINEYFGIEPDSRYPDYSWVYIR